MISADWQSSEQERAEAFRELGRLEGFIKIYEERLRENIRKGEDDDTGPTWVEGAQLALDLFVVEFLKSKSPEAVFDK